MPSASICNGLWLKRSLIRHQPGQNRWPDAIPPHRPSHFLFSASPSPAWKWAGLREENSLLKVVQGHLTRNDGMEFSKGQFMLNYKRNFLRVRSMRLQRGPRGKKAPLLESFRLWLRSIRGNKFACLILSSVRAGSASPGKAGWKRH